MENTTSAIATLEETITEKEKQIERSVTYSCVSCTTLNTVEHSYSKVTVDHSYSKNTVTVKIQ